MTAHRPEVNRTGWLDRLVCVDTETGGADWLSAGDRCAIGEPVIVPRGEAERDAWVLALVWDVERRATHLAIWDGAQSGAGPIARAWYDQDVPLGLHGCWIPS